ncbi:unnamed protein product [Ilex paraguariensis]|uniref:Uncharacterized protein n=1 Tax=Ilex paraguariensis TaxID=185542 RepID=A0ABC8V2K4_9AQUA
MDATPVIPMLERCYGELAADWSFMQLPDSAPVGPCGDRLLGESAPELTGRRLGDFDVRGCGSMVEFMRKRVGLVEHYIGRFEMRMSERVGAHLARYLARNRASYSAGLVCYGHQGRPAQKAGLDFH